jgi:DNA-binding transcriptional MerR regulator
MTTNTILVGTQKEMETAFNEMQNISIRYYEQNNHDWIAVIRHAEDLKDKINNIVSIKELLELDSQSTRKQKKDV